MPISPLPSVPSLRTCGAVALTHALSLNALTWVNISNQRLSKQRLATRNHFAVNPAGHLESSLKPYAADPLNGDFDLIIQLHHAIHGVGPRSNRAMPTRNLLRGRRKPHAVHQWCLQAHQLGSIIRGMDRVVVTRNSSKWSHIRRSGDHYPINERPWGRFDFYLGTAIIRSRYRGVSARLTTPNSKTLHHGCYQLILGVQLQFNGNNTAGSRLRNGSAP